MTKPNNAARVAVGAKPCQKQPDLQPRDALDCIALGLPLSAITQAMPTLQQTMLTALAFVQCTLEHLVCLYRDARRDGGDMEVDVNGAVELALEHVKRLRHAIPAQRPEFDREWLRAAAAINLAARSYAQTQTAYYRWLTAAQRQFEVLVEMVEFVDEGARSADMPDSILKGGAA